MSESRLEACQKTLSHKEFGRKQDSRAPWVLENVNSGWPELTGSIFITFGTRLSQSCLCCHYVGEPVIASLYIISLHVLEAV